MYLLDKQKPDYSEEIHESIMRFLISAAAPLAWFSHALSLQTSPQKGTAVFFTESKASASQMIYKSSQVSEQKGFPSTNVSPRTKKSLSTSKTLNSDVASAFY